MQAIILAAGRGKRLSPLTDITPKPLIEVGGTPMLKLTLDSLPENLDEILIITGYLEKQIKVWVKQNYSNLPITFFTQNPLDGTGGAIFQAAKANKIHWPCLVVNGDDLYKKEDLQSMTQTHTSQMLVWEKVGPLKGSVKINSKDDVVGLENVEAKSLALECCGAYFLTQEFLQATPAAVKTHAGLEISLPHTLAGNGDRLATTVKRASFWLRVGTFEELEKANELIKF